MHFCLELTGELTGNLSTQKTNKKKSQQLQTSSNNKKTHPILFLQLFTLLSIFFFGEKEKETELRK